MSSQRNSRHSPIIDGHHSQQQQQRQQQPLVRTRSSAHLFLDQFTGTCNSLLRRLSVKVRYLSLSLVTSPSPQRRRKARSESEDSSSRLAATSVTGSSGGGFRSRNTTERMRPRRHTATVLTTVGSTTTVMDAGEELSFDPVSRSPSHRKPVRNDGKSSSDSETTPTPSPCIFDQPVLPAAVQSYLGAAEGSDYPTLKASSMSRRRRRHRKNQADASTNDGIGVKSESPVGSAYIAASASLASASAPLALDQCMALDLNISSATESLAHDQVILLDEQLGSPRRDWNEPLPLNPSVFYGIQHEDNDKTKDVVTESPPPPPPPPLPLPEENNPDPNWFDEFAYPAYSSKSSSSARKKSCSSRLTEKAYPYVSSPPSNSRYLDPTQPYSGYDYYDIIAEPPYLKKKIASSSSSSSGGGSFHEPTTATERGVHPGPESLSSDPAPLSSHHLHTSSNSKSKTLDCTAVASKIDSGFVAPPTITVFPATFHFAISEQFVCFIFFQFFLFRACVCVCVSYRFGSATKTWPSCSGMTIGKHPSSRSTPPAHARITNSSLLRLHLTFSSNSACFSFILIRRLDQSIIFIADGILSLITSELDSLMKLTLNRCC